MSYSFDGRYNGNQGSNHSGSGGDGSVEHKSSTAVASAPPRKSTLANLLSSQRRSAAQSDRHRIQRALPFANLHNNNDLMSKVNLNSDAKIEKINSFDDSNDIRKLQVSGVLEKTQLMAKELKGAVSTTLEIPTVAGMPSLPVTKREIKSTKPNATNYSSISNNPSPSPNNGLKNRARSVLMEQNNVTNNHSAFSHREKIFCRFTPPSSTLSAKRNIYGDTTQQHGEHSNHPRKCFFATNERSSRQTPSRFTPPPSLSQPDSSDKARTKKRVSFNPSSTPDNDSNKCLLEHDRPSITSSYCGQERISGQPCRVDHNIMQHRFIPRETMTIRGNDMRKRKFSEHYTGVSESDGSKVKRSKSYKRSDHCCERYGIDHSDLSINRYSFHPGPSIPIENLHSCNPEKDNTCSMSDTSTSSYNKEQDDNSNLKKSIEGSATGQNSEPFEYKTNFQDRAVYLEGFSSDKHKHTGQFSNRSLDLRCMTSSSPFLESSHVNADRSPARNDSLATVNFQEHNDCSQILNENPRHAALDNSSNEANVTRKNHSTNSVQTSSCTDDAPHASADRGSIDHQWENQLLMKSVIDREPTLGYTSNEKSKRHNDDGRLLRKDIAREEENDNKYNVMKFGSSSGESSTKLQIGEVDRPLVSTENESSPSKPMIGTEDIRFKTEGKSTQNSIEKDDMRSADGRLHQKISTSNDINEPILRNNHDSKRTEENSSCSFNEGNTSEKLNSSIPRSSPERILPKSDVDWVIQCKRNAETLSSKLGLGTRQKDEEKKKKKKKNDFSPFRVKVGCVVAVRFRSLADGGNPKVKKVYNIDGVFKLRRNPEKTNQLIIQKSQNGDGFPETNGCRKSDISASTEKREKSKLNMCNPKFANKSNETVVERPVQPHLLEVWCDPTPGKDEGLALLGSRVRCCFSKSTISSWQAQNVQQSNNSLKRILEGNVVKIIRDDSGEGTMCVGLLVDRASIKSLPYLKALADSEHDSKLSDSIKKRRKLETKIRGINKVVVIVTLASNFGRRMNSEFTDDVVLHWVVRKRVCIPKPIGTKSNRRKLNRNKIDADSLFIGDRNDSAAQQEKNWRWLASRIDKDNIREYGDHSIPKDIVIDETSRLIGEVINVEIPSSSTSNGADTLAVVTVRRLWIPEQTRGGRLNCSALEMFDDISCVEKGSSYFQAPVEDLIVVGKRVVRYINGLEKKDPGSELFITHSYNPDEDAYTPLGLLENTGKSENPYCYCYCYYCRRPCGETEAMNKSCFLEKDKLIGPCCYSSHPPLRDTDSNDDLITEFLQERAQSKSDSSYTLQTDLGLAISELAASITSLNSPKEFILPCGFCDFPLRPSFLPNNGTLKRECYTKSESRISKGKKSVKSLERLKNRLYMKAESKSKKECQMNLDVSEDESVFKPTCCRLLPFEKIKKKHFYTSHGKTASKTLEIESKPSYRENARARAVVVKKVEVKSTLTGRAARANQRRMLKSLATIGGDSNVNVDRLAGRDREQQLRFGKSPIHGWGVFAEEAINAGDMIIEYRGELIGNAVADKREVDYERAKIGSDYMFRIDEFTVCDATKLGNVARFINASCNPNCYTQIITANENKRIVIYARKNIQRGEELCYDYKFPIEYDESKRIPCHCGSPDCRGFMNWVSFHIGTPSIRSPGETSSMSHACLRRFNQTTLTFTFCFRTKSMSSKTKSRRRLNIPSLLSQT